MRTGGRNALNLEMVEAWLLHKPGTCLESKGLGIVCVEVESKLFKSWSKSALSFLTSETLIKTNGAEYINVTT